MGGLPEWLKGADCKSAGYAYTGSNPVAPIGVSTIDLCRLAGIGAWRGLPDRGCSSMVEQQPSKLNTRVRFPSPALRDAAVAQW